MGKQLGIPHHKGAREMEAGRSEKKQTGSDKVTRQKSGLMHITEPKQCVERVAWKTRLQRAAVLG